MATVETELDETTALTVVDSRERRYTAEQIDLIRKTVARDATDLEFAFFLELAALRRLNPLAKDIFLVKRWDAQAKAYVATPQTGISGYRLIAERTGRYVPGIDAVYTERNGKLIAATAFVKKFVKNEWHVVSATAYLDEFIQTTKEGAPTQFWRKMPRLMLAKCAEALALRRAFPDQLSGIYTHEEMGTDVSDDGVPQTITVQPEPRSRNDALVLDPVDTGMASRPIDPQAPTLRDKAEIQKRKAVAPPTTTRFGPATADQKSRIKNLVEALQGFGMTIDQLQRRLKERVGVDSLKAVDTNQAEVAIDTFAAMLREFEAAIGPVQDETEQASAEVQEPKKVDVPF